MYPIIDFRLHCLSSFQLYCFLIFCVSSKYLSRSPWAKLCTCVEVHKYWEYSALFIKTISLGYIISKDKTNKNINLHLNKTQLQQVQEFCYLGSTITTDNKSTSDIKKRIALAKKAFENKKKLLINKSLNMDIRKRFIKTFV